LLFHICSWDMGVYLWIYHRVILKTEKSHSLDLW
jgi:hypothetical protein